MINFHWYLFYLLYLHNIGIFIFGSQVIFFFRYWHLVYYQELLIIFFTTIAIILFHY